MPFFVRATPSRGDELVEFSPPFKLGFLSEAEADVEALPIVSVGLPQDAGNAVFGSNGFDVREGATCLARAAPQDSVFLTATDAPV